MAQVTQLGKTNDCKLILEVEKQLKPQMSCGPEFNNLADLQKAGDELSEDLMFATLSKYRLKKNECAIPQLKALTANKEEQQKYCDGIQKNLAKLATEISRSERIKLQLKKAKESDKNRIRAHLKLVTGRISVLQNSIHYGETDFVKGFTGKYLNQINAKALSIGAVNSLSDIELMPIDTAEYQADCAKAYANLLGSLSSDQKIYKQASKGRPEVLTRLYKESMIQDIDLMTEFYQNENDLVDKRKEMCRLDAKYGTGAENRDQALFFGSIGAAAFSGGAGVLGRTMFFATVQTTTKVAAARSLTSLSIAKMAGSTAIALNSVQALKTFDSCVQQDTPEIKTTGSDMRCEKLTVEDFAKQDCILDGALALLGGGLSTKYAQEYIAKLGSKVGLIVPFKEDEIRRFQNSTAEERLRDRVHFNESEARQHKLLSDESIAELNKDKTHSVPGSANIATEPYEKLLERPLSRDELLAIAHARKAHDSVDEQKNALRKTGKFSDGDIYKILKHHVHQEHSEHKAYQAFYLNEATALNRQKGITSVSLDKPGETRFAGFESKMKEVEDKFVFANENDKNEFFYYRNLKKEDVDAPYKNTTNEELKQLFDKHTFDPRSIVEDEYRKVLKVAEKLGTPDIKKLKHSYGHVDSDSNSNIFSLRLQPLFSPKAGGGVVQSNPRMRALLCKQPDGKIRVLAVYTKETFVDEETFPAYEREVYQNSRQKIQAEGIKCVSPSG